MQLQNRNAVTSDLHIFFADSTIKESNKNRAPAFTFGSRHEKKLVSNSPAPNVYNTSRLNPRGKTIVFLPFYFHTTFFI